MQAELEALYMHACIGACTGADPRIEREGFLRAERTQKFNHAQPNHAHSI